MEDSQFYTMKGYELNSTSLMSPSSEDYVEMICRMYKRSPFIRVSELASNLNVKQSSVSKMVEHLKENNLVKYEKYGYIVPTKKGVEIGNYFLFRHEILHKWLCYINNSENELAQVEKIEHFLDKRTIMNIKKFLDNI